MELLEDDVFFNLFPLNEIFTPFCEDIKSVEEFTNDILSTITMMVKGHNIEYRCGINRNLDVVIYRKETEEEKVKRLEYEKHQKQMRRIQYLKLKEEFENE